MVSVFSQSATAEGWDFSVLAKELMSYALQICRDYLPSGKQQGNEWVARNPKRADNNLGSFSVNLQTGKWGDFATNSKGGDLISLVAYLKNCTQGEAAQELQGRYIGSSATTTKPASRQQAEWEPIAPVPDDVPDPKMKHYQHGDCSKYWTYRNTEGHRLAFLCRFDKEQGGKDILPSTYCQNQQSGIREWRWKGLSEPRPLFNLDKLAARPEATVIVTEGEKAAEAVGKMMLGIVATTSMHGAQSPHKTDWAPLKGRNILIWPDSDATGKAYANRVIDLVRQAGAKQIRIFNIEKFAAEGSELSKGWDAADALAEGWTQERITALVKSDPDFLIEVDLSNPSQEGNSTSSNPGEPGETSEAVGGMGNSESHPVKAEGGTGEKMPFFLTTQGVYFQPDDPEQAPRWVCSPLKVAAQVRGTTNENWGRLLEVTDPDGVVHQWCMPMDMLKGGGEEYRGHLLGLGLQMDTSTSGRNYLTRYIQTFKPKTKARCVKKVGWHGQAFVLPNAVIQLPETERVYFQSDFILKHGIQTSGNLDEWRQFVADKVRGNSRLVLAVCTSFAPPLLHLLGVEGGGVHLRGGSSIGKTTSLYLAASLWGSPEYIKNWRFTDNGIEGVAAIHNHLPLLLDELGQVDPKQAGDIAYMLANGQGKGRASKSGATRSLETWRLLFLSTGEISLAQHSNAAARRTSAGQEVRILDISADAGAGLGAFENLQGSASASDFARLLRTNTSKYFGTAGPAFISCLLNDINALAEKFKVFRKEFLENNVPDGADGQVARAMERFAVIAFAGELATAYSITGWERGEALASVVKCLESWIDARGGGGPQEHKAMLAQVRLFLEQYGESRFGVMDEEGQKTDSDRITINRAGFRRRKADWKQNGPDLEYFILPEVFKKEICAGFNHADVARMLHDIGVLIKASDGKFTRSERLPEIGKTRVYRLTSEIMTHGME